MKLKYNVIMWNVILLIYKEGIMEIYEEVDIVIGEKKEFFCDIVIEFINMEIGMLFIDFICLC